MDSRIYDDEVSIIAIAIAFCINSRLVVSKNRVWQVLGAELGYNRFPVQIVHLLIAIIRNNDSMSVYVRKSF